MKQMDFIQLAETITDLRGRIATHQQVRLDAKREMAGQEYALLSQIDFAVLGRNDKERDFAKAGLLRESREWSNAEATLYLTERTLIDLEAQLAAFLDIRRAAEWELRGLMVARWYAAGDEPAATDAGMDERTFA